MPGGLGDRLAGHLAAAAYYLDDEPHLAYEHAAFARSLAGRLASVREVAGIAGYRAGRFAEALADLRAARRMTGRDDLVPMMADCERGLGRPERALAMAEESGARRLDIGTRVELLLVAAGARGDLGQRDAAVLMLQVPELNRASTEPWAARLRYGYADALLAAGRREEARRWFAAAAEVDASGVTDAADRAADLG